MTKSKLLKTIVKQKLYIVSRANLKVTSVVERTEGLDNKKNKGEKMVYIQNKIEKGGEF